MIFKLCMVEFFFSSDNEVYLVGIVYRLILPLSFKNDL
jgi:hypothetical protein